MTEVQSWINKGSNAIPEWATAHVVGRRDPNGAFLITTLCGKERAQARCHSGMMLIERAGVIYTRHPSDDRAQKLRDVLLMAYAEVAA